MRLIEVVGVWKTYGNRSRYGLKDRLVGKAPLADGRFSRRWVLQDISMSIDSGSSVGIVGHNGTGKSTLLSLLLGTIKEDRGTIRRQGRHGAMLELGAGFHPDLTGRENIFLNGSILGLRIHEIRKSFDSIVAFSELAEAIEQPVRTYSSGMSARLAFAVLAHAHRDVLLIDEIISVGDASFQARCLSYFQEFVAQGGTLVVVSHDLGVLQTLCVDGICLREGKMVDQGRIGDVVSGYRRMIEREAEAINRESIERGSA